MKQFIFREIPDSEVFDPTSLVSNTPFTQANFYGEWQKSLDRKVSRFLVNEIDVAAGDKVGKTVAYFQIIKYPLIFKKNYLYIPYGPVVKEISKDLFVALKKELKKISRKENAVFTRLDFTPPIGVMSGPEMVSETATDLVQIFTKAPKYTYHSAYFQPRLEWFLDLNKSEEQILTEMHKNTRYSIKTSEKREVATQIITENFLEYFEPFYELIQETAKRDGFNLHQKRYYQNIFENLDKSYGYLSVARFGRKILSVDIFIIFGKTSNYVFGCSSNEERNRLPSYAAQWRAIQYAKERGCTEHSFGGISTQDKTYKGWDGLSSFKRKFGGREVQHSDFYDVVVKPFWYHAYNLRKRLRKLS